MFSDVELARSKWKMALMIALSFIFGIWNMVPVVISRKRYAALLNCEDMYDEALRVIHTRKRTDP